MTRVPEFGITLSFQAHRASGQGWDTAYRQGLELAAEASRLGFASIWVGEHHGEEDGYCPSPVVAGAALAAVAPNCRIGQSIAIAPLQGHPLRLAEDLAVLDNLSGGRVELGLGMGYAPHEFRGFGVLDNLSGGRAEIGLGQGYRPAEYAAFGAAWGRRTRAFEEALDILALAWRGERFDYDGQVHRVAGGLLRPPPVAPGAPPLWLGAAVRAARARVVARRAGLILSPIVELELAARQFASFDRETAAAGAAPLPRAMMREILIGASPADALHRHARGLDHVYRVQYAPERTNAAYVDAAGRRVPLTAADPYYLSEAYVAERWFAGTPEAIADTIAGWQPRLGLDRLVFHPLQPGLPLADAVADMETVAREIVPRVRERLAGAAPINTGGDA